jgi:hypothetical protein
MKRIIAFIAIALSTALQAATTTVHTAAELTTAINNLSPGDTIILADGTYSHSGLTIDVAATSTDPVVIKAANVGGAHWQGYLRLYDSSYVTIEGLVFDAEAQRYDSQNIHMENSEHCRITRCLFDLDESGAGISDIRYWLVVESGRYNEIDHCQFNAKKTTQATLKVIYNEYRPNIHHNWFNGRTYPGSNLNGYETLQLGSGSSGCKMESMQAKIDYNLFEECDGEAEIVSVKTSDNYIRFNTFQECRGQLVLRMADNCEVYNNYFLNPSLKTGAGGIRIHGSYNEIYNNYFHKLTDEAIETRFGDTDTTGGTEETKYRQSIGNLIAYNTMYSSRTHVLDFGTADSTYTLPPKDWDIVNNIFTIYQAGLIDGSGDTNTFYENNIADEFGGISDITDMGRTLSSNEMWVVYFGLTVGTDGIYRQTSSSPGRNQATYITDIAYLKDLDHESRDTTPDIGADEYRSYAPSYHPLTSSDVGPTAY